jgi:prolyl-tRNA synthetase
LQAIQDNLLKKATAFRDAHVFDVKSVAEIAEFFKADKMGLVRCDVALLNDPKMDETRKAYSLTPRCMPFADEGKKVLIGRSY